MNLELEYKKIKDDYLDFLKEVERVVDKILLQHKIPIAFGISARLKEVDSILEKNNSSRFTIDKSITELNDFVGLRIVLLFPEFKEKVIKILLEEFKLLADYNSKETIVHTFGYSSVHLILGVKDEWLKTPDWKNHANKKIEIQIRTLSEHIWAETSHSLFYKREENIPKIVTRDLYRLAALLEVVDEKMQNIKKSVESHFEYIKKCSYEIILTMDLNPETFKRVMLKNSKGIYNLDDKKNKILSSRIEYDYNIINTQILESIISDKIDLTVLDSNIYVEDVIELLETYKKEIDEKPKNDI